MRASDVLHLHALKDKLDAMLAREGRADLADACFRFLPDRVRLDIAGWAAEDIFAHSLSLRAGACGPGGPWARVCRGRATFLGYSNPQKKVKLASGAG